MSADELAIVIKKMRALDYEDDEILLILQQGGYEGTSLPNLENIIPSANPEGTKQVITLEEITHEQRMAEKGVRTEAQKVLDPAVKVRQLEKEAEENETGDELLKRRLRF